MDKDKPKNQHKQALTCIHPAYTLSDTPEPESNETGALMVKDFLETLAEISISIASRVKNQKERRQ